MHPEKTRLIEFGRYAADDRAERGVGKPETFNFLGFTHICGRTRGGDFQLRRKTRRDRMRASCSASKGDCERRLHEPIPNRGVAAAGGARVLRVPRRADQLPALAAFRHHVIDLWWQRTLRRRSQKDRTTWERITGWLTAYLPNPRITHPWPSARFAVKYPRWEPYAGIPPAGICAGGAQ